MTVLDKNIDTQINTFLYNTKLVAKILDSANDGKHYTFQSTGLTLNRGYVVFIRKIANKLIELQKNNEEVANFLESIPEWKEYVEEDLEHANKIDNQPLGSDPRKKSESNSDDYFDLISKWKDVGKRSGFQSSKKNSI